MTQRINRKGPDPCFGVPRLSRQDHEAIRALYNGEASESQQRLALEVIVKKFAQPQDLLFVPGAPDETGFVNGRAFVASQIRYYATTSPSQTQHEVTSDASTD